LSACEDDGHPRTREVDGVGRTLEDTFVFDVDRAATSCAIEMDNAVGSEE
jgi:hypothetical protein